MIFRRAAAPVAVYVGVFLLLIRHPAHKPAWHQLWAEDGRIFLGCQVQHGLECVAKPWGGYLHVVPRLLTAVASLTPVPDWAWVMSLFAFLVDALCLTIIYATSGWLIRSPWLRAAAVGIIAASAAAHWEAAGNIANLHWFLLPAAILVALNPEASDARLRLVGRTIWLTLACFSEALALLVAAAYVVGILRRRGGWRAATRIDIALGAWVTAIGVLQFLVHYVVARAAVTGPEPSARTVASLYRHRVLDWGWLGPSHNSDTPALVLVIGVLVALAMGAAVLLEHRGGIDRAAVIGGAALVLTSIVIYAETIEVNRHDRPRYLFTPFLFMIVGLVALAVGAVSALHPIARIGVPLALLASLLGLLLANPPLGARVALDRHSWRSGVAAAVRDCHSDPQGGRLLYTAPPLPQWVFTVSCRRLVG